MYHGVVFGVAGTKKAEFCSQHTEDGMIHVYSKGCGPPGCTRMPPFGMVGRMKQEFCSQHAKEEMGIV